MGRDWQASGAADSAHTLPTRAVSSLLLDLAKGRKALGPCRRWLGGAARAVGELERERCRVGYLG